MRKKKLPRKPLPMPPREVSLRILPRQVTGAIDERIYGHFLEHIFHSVNGGLWGEMVWDRSFEDAAREKNSDGSPQVSGGWQAFGPGRFEQTRDNPLNSDWCQAIEAGAREAGVRQSPFFIEKGAKYSGSLFARGAARGLTLRLREGRRVLAEARLGRVSGGWTRHAFSFRAIGTGSSATLEVAVAPSGRVWLDQVSLMPDAARRSGGMRPDLLKAIADLRPPVIRYPGGSFTCWYRWRDAVGPQHLRRKYPMHIWGDQDVNSFGTDEFMDLCRRVGAEPLLCVNIGTLEPEAQREAYIREACDWIEYCNAPPTRGLGRLRAKNGHPKPYRVKYWELGNECWNLKPRQYAALVPRFARAMKRVDPSIRIITCGSGEHGKTWGRGDGAVFRRAAAFADFHSVHHYAPAERFAEGPRDAERFYRRLARQIARSANPRLKLYVSEWNCMTTDWRTGLYAGGILNVFERCSGITPMAGPALFLRHVCAQGWDNAFVNFDHKAWFPAPNYVVMKLWRDHYAPHRIGIKGRTRPLDLVATRSSDGRTVFLKCVNAGGAAIPVTVQLDGGPAKARASLRVVAPGGTVLRNMLGDPDRVRVEPGKVEARDGAYCFTMPGLSVAVLKLVTPLSDLDKRW